MNLPLIDRYIKDLITTVYVPGGWKKHDKWRSGIMYVRELYHNLLEFKTVSTSIHDGLHTSHISKHAYILYALLNTYTVTLPLHKYTTSVDTVIRSFYNITYNTLELIKDNIEHKFSLHHEALCIKNPYDRHLAIKLAMEMKKAYSKVRNEISVSEFVKVWFKDGVGDSDLNRIGNGNDIFSMLRGKVDMYIPKRVHDVIYRITKIDIHNDLFYHKHNEIKAKIKANLYLSDILVSLFVRNMRALYLYRTIIVVYSRAVCMTKDNTTIHRMIFESIIDTYKNRNTSASMFFRTLQQMGARDLFNKLTQATHVGNNDTRNIVIDDEKAMSIYKEHKMFIVLDRIIEKFRKNIPECSFSKMSMVDSFFVLLLRQHIPHNIICSVLIYINGVDRHNPKFLDICTGLCGEICAGELDNSKFVNNLLKSGGLGNSADYNILIETSSLMGKYSDDEIIDKDIKYRIAASGVASHGHSIDNNRLMKCVTDLFDKSIGKSKILTIDLEKSWDRRWATCKGGSHKIRDEVTVLHKQVCPDDIKEATKRHFIENIEENILFKTKPECIISPSIKNENGKNRVIYSCDTINYLNFDTVFKHIEGVFNSNRVILKPGDTNINNMCTKLLQRSTEICYSLDYEDFNSQHSIENMCVVINALRKYIGNRYCDWMLESMRNAKVYYKGKLHKWFHSLPSGHRLTTFINSVLNYSYVKIMLEDVGIENYDSIHAGDDCVIFIKNKEDVDAIIGSTINNKYGIRFNKSKQCLGETFEFLRMSYSKKVVRGYISRSIGSIVNGNWTNSTILAHDEYINCINQMSYTLYNRGGLHYNDSLLCTVMRHCQLSLREAIEYIEGRLSINNGIIYGTGDVVKCIEYSYEKYYEDKDIAKYKSYATDAYIQRCLLPIEYEVVKHKKLMPFLHSRMKGGSYKCITHTCVSKVREYNLKRSLALKVIDWVNSEASQKGLLEFSLPFKYLKSVLSAEDIRYITKYLIGTDDVIDSEILWGSTISPIFCSGGIPYSTAAYFASQMCSGCYIGTDIPVLV